MAALARDFVQVQQINFGRLMDFHVPGEQNKSTEPNQKETLIQQYPHLAHIFENPDDEIPNLFQNTDWQSIGNLMDLTLDSEMREIFQNNLFAADDITPNSIRQHYIQHPQTDSEVLRSLLWSPFFSKPHDLNMAALVSKIINHPQTDSMVLILLIQNTFSQPHIKGMTDLILKTINHPLTDSEVLHYLAQYTFSKPHSMYIPSNIIERFLQRGREFGAKSSFFKSVEDKFLRGEFSILSCKNLL